MLDHYCKNLLPDGTCKKSGLLCLETLPTNSPNQNPSWLDTDFIPSACKNCSNHPSNCGSGICFCTLGSIGSTAVTTTGSEDVQYTFTCNTTEE